MARVMLNSKKVPRNLWAEAVNTACYVSNRVFKRPGTKQTSYELWKGKKPNIDDLSMLNLCDDNGVNEPKENMLNDTNTPIDVASSVSSQDDEIDSHIEVVSQGLEML
ncbi:hypothetical protein LWI29_025072 [Acer saccharum]|uniref:Uncharacterized protein n=1 Tax=Acer saccharum TaxID=4024 RepID=A0AA39RLW3_ACESA|nr:hypothetical protein LWI29_025072 [Acer saccharum]